MPLAHLDGINTEVEPNMLTGEKLFYIVHRNHHAGSIYGNTFPSSFSTLDPFVPLKAPQRNEKKTA